MLVNSFAVPSVNLALKDEIEAVNKKLMEAFKAQNPKAIASLYTEDCIFMPPQSDAVTGREGITVYNS